MAADRHGASEMELELAPEPTSVTHARHAVSDVARRLGAPERDVALAVSEAVGNAVVHAFRGRDGGTITVSVRPRGDMLLVTVADDGGGMTPNLDSPGLGVGIALISQLAREISLSSSDRGTTLSMSFEMARQGEDVTAGGARRGPER